MALMYFLDEYFQHMRFKYSSKEKHLSKLVFWL